MHVVVDAAPPAKDGALSVRGAAHPSFPLVQALRDAIVAQVDESERIVGQQIVLTMHYERARSRADALNLINGVADVIQRRGNPVDTPWLIDDDFNIREFSYSETSGEQDRYTIDVAARL